jgi:arabinan endo-1,5-alpha-L-arabinosidase
MGIARLAVTARILTAVVLVGTLSGPLGATAAAAATGAATPSATLASTDPIAHDPTMIKQGAYYYLYITGDSGVPNTYLPMKRSKDLIHWEEMGPVFSAPPQWIVATLGITPHDFWAPDISYFNGKYYLYYAASQFGVNNSVIALATNATLDPTSPNYHWVDQGPVLRSVAGDTFNAIDPNVTFDQHGTPWLSYGSFWSGILMRRMDAATGKLSTADTTIVPLVDRRWPPNAVEGPSIVRHGNYYYLFASFDYCCRGADSEYRTVVGRSAAITGPYLDESGQPMLNGGGTELLRSYNEFAGPGGGDVYVDRANDWFVHHYYDVNDNGRPKLSVRKLKWNNGWPTVSDPLSGSRDIGHGPAYFALVERTHGNVIGAVPGGPQAPLCGYEGDNIALLAPSSNPCSQWRMEYAADGYDAIRNRQSNKVFDTAFCGYSDGTNVGQWGWLHNDCQQFRFAPTTDGWTQIQNKNQPADQPGKYVDAGVTCEPGANIQLWSPDSQRCQQYRLQPIGRVLLIGASTGRAIGGECVRRADAAAEPGGNTAGACGRWLFVHTDQSYYRIVGPSGGALPVQACGREGKPAGLRACDQWQLEPLNDGTFRLIDRVTGQVAGLSDGADAHLQLQTWTGAANQRLTLILP